MPEQSAEEVRQGCVVGRPLAPSVQRLIDGIPVTREMGIVTFETLHGLMDDPDAPIGSARFKDIVDRWRSHVEESVGVKLAWSKADGGCRPMTVDEQTGHGVRRFDWARKHVRRGMRALGVIGDEEMNAEQRRKRDGALGRGAVMLRHMEEGVSAAKKHLGGKPTPQMPRPKPPPGVNG